jgi:hypothetical protein
MERSLETRLEGASTTLTWNSVLWVNETGARWMLQWSVDDERCAFFAIWDLQKSLLGHVTTDQSPFDNQRKYTKQTPLLVHDKDLSFLLLLKHLWLLPAVEIPVEKSFTLARQSSHTIDSQSSCTSLLKTNSFQLCWLSGSVWDPRN